MRKHEGKLCKFFLKGGLKENDNFTANKQYMLSVLAWVAQRFFGSVKLLLIALIYYREKKKSLT